MHNMVGAVRSITEGRGSNFFLFVDQQTPLPAIHSDCLDDGQGEQREAND